MFFLVFLLSLVAPSYAQEPPQQVLLDKLSATVNNEPIIHSDVMKKVHDGPLVTVSAMPATLKSSEYEQARNDLINYKLIRQFMRESNQDLENADVELEVNRILNVRKMTREQLKDFLERQNKSYQDFSQDIRKQMFIRYFQGRVLFAKLYITEEDVRTYFKSKMGLSSGNISITIEQISVDLSTLVKTEVSPLLIEFSQAIRKQPDKLAEVRKHFRTRGLESRSTVIRDIRLKDFAKSIREIIEKLEVGETSLFVFTKRQAKLFIVREKKIADEKFFAKNRLHLEEELKMNRLQKELERWLEKKRRVAEIHLF